MNLRQLGIANRLGRRRVHIPAQNTDLRRDVCHRKRCGARLVVRTDGNGGTVAVCPPCARNLAGFCRGCPSRTTATNGRFVMWCRACRKKNDTERHRLAYRADPAAGAAKRRRYYDQETPEQRAHRLEKQRRWRAAHPVNYNDPQYRAYRRVTQFLWIQQPAVNRRRNNRRNRRKWESRKKLVAAGDVRRLTTRDAIWLWQQALAA